MFNPGILHIASTYTFCTSVPTGKTPGPLLVDGTPVPSGAGITVTLRFTGPGGTFERPATYNGTTQAWSYAVPATDFPDASYAGAWQRAWRVQRTDVTPNIDVPSEPAIDFTVLAY
jgi:hypothetical protein